MIHPKLSCTLSALSTALAMVMLANNASAQWIEKLPKEIRDSILWSADVEEGDLNDWKFRDFKSAGGGVFNTGGNQVEADAAKGIAHSGQYSVKTRITKAFRAQNGSRAIRLMRWTNRPWDDQGSYFPAKAYYSTWMYFPTTYNPNKHPRWDPGDGGWWNVFQFKANDNKDKSQPVWTLNVGHNDQSNKMAFYLNSDKNSPSSHAQENPIAIPIGRWVHVEAFYRVSTRNTGRITIWQDGKQILNVDNVSTAISPDDANAIWGIGNYTDHIAGDTVEGSATIYFDDAVVSTRRVSAHLD